eukprot:gnl/TRDRNA2_/TRDRNA2_130245_c0_seq2.p1 gnl/TRDRNA2_/TRDRNA2_130245_c0~~gnl/TRDRNA2_/TRDRNA2_130245_c0_seq2.p1  ORF type:complete len:102 (-),score=13.29 gnl/TRDRNA2_/TRDRNA2_130245_c0_seq2:91-396(-)
MVIFVGGDLFSMWPGRRRLWRFGKSLVGLDSVCSLVMKLVDNVLSRLFLRFSGLVLGFGDQLLFLLLDKLRKFVRIYGLAFFMGLWQACKRKYLLYQHVVR